MSNFKKSPVTAKIVEPTLFIIDFLPSRSTLENTGLKKISTTNFLFVISTVYNETIISDHHLPFAIIYLLLFVLNENRITHWHNTVEIFTLKIHFFKMFSQIFHMKIYCSRYISSFTAHSINIYLNSSL